MNRATGFVKLSAIARIRQDTEVRSIHSYVAAPSLLRCWRSYLIDSKTLILELELAARLADTKSIC